MAETALFLGIEIGGTKLQMVTGTASGEIVNSKRFAVVAGAGAAVICEQLEEGLHALVTDEVKAVGVGFGGPVDYRSGTIATSHQVSGWNDFNLAEWLNQLTGLPVTVENDANTAALAEALHGSGKGFDTVFYMTIGSGIGGGLVLNGNSYHGRSPGEVEVGHLRLNKEGQTLEEKCAGWAVDKRVREAIDNEPGGLLAVLRKAHSGPEAALLTTAVLQNDQTAKQIIHEVAGDLAFGLSHVVHLFHPDVMVIGGGLSFLNEILLAPVRNRLPHYIMQAFLPPPELKIAALGENAVPVGALALAKKAYQRQNSFETNRSSL